eukprot:CAMPEP_0197884456 /NCGR_PEP_ID=MMETSP1439-20131203/10898_1 /TAXON_ID=66791 /ORGANISM="Gonyaulax spinifera, Strain CCMP409" /LENGTH=459 /DNA_ID=CAMNT_0043504189 /DNA_START=47 /DNA_END=1426 /DNA_ORIENTATION=+
MAAATGAARGFGPRDQADGAAARMAAKAANFKQAIEMNKKQKERENSDRTKRYQLLEEFTSKADDDEHREDMMRRFEQQERDGVRAQCKVWTTDDFMPVRVIGQGSYGTVHLVKHRGTDEYLALKQMAKARYSKKNLRERAYAEREILAEARNRWFVELKMTFQDAENVYMAMEFLQGGDLCTHLEHKLRFSKEETAFYMAELLQAIDVVHRAGFVHRDVKPDNVVLDSRGHLKLLDFGLCKADPGATVEQEAEAKPAASGKLPSTRRQRLKSQVGTPQYMSPEAYRGAMGPAGDLWALGIMAFECLYGSVPFHAGLEEGPKAIMMVAQKVKNYKDTFPPRLHKAMERGFIGSTAEDFLCRVVCDVSERLDVESMRHHPFFEGIDFERVHLATPPIRPRVSGAGDARHFEDFGVQPLPRAPRGLQKDPTMEWAHYEFDRTTHDLQRPEAVVELFTGATP